MKDKEKKNCFKLKKTKETWQLKIMRDHGQILGQREN